MRLAAPALVLTVSLCTLVAVSPRVLAEPPAGATPAPAAGAASQGKAAPHRTIALLSFEVAGDNAAQLNGVMERSVTQALKSAGVQVIAQEEVAAILAPTPELTACTSSTCLTRISQLVGSREMLRAHLVSQGASYRVDLDLLAPGSETPTAQVERSCSVCTVGELTDLVAHATTDLLSGAGAPGMVTVEIHCRPAGALITIDDQPRGPAPFRGPLRRGRHRIVATLDGHLAAVKVVDIDPSGGSRTIQLILAPTGVVGGPMRPYRTIKWVTAGGAAAVLAASVALLVVDGHGTCTSSHDSCPRVYNTAGAGLVGVALGLAAGGASAWMFVRDRDGERRPR